MINEKDIVARLMAGESIDDIMNEITKNVNSALQEKERLDKEAEEAKRKAEAEHARQEAEKLSQEAKRNAIYEIINGLRNLATIYGWNEVVEVCDDFDETDAKELIEMIEQYAELFKMYTQIGGLTFPLGGSSPKVEAKTQPKAKIIEIDKNPTVEAKTAKALNASDAINRFLKGYGLI